MLFRPPPPRAWPPAPNILWKLLVPLGSRNLGSRTCCPPHLGYHLQALGKHPEPQFVYLEKGTVTATLY